MLRTTVLEKAAPSLINALVVIYLALPLYVVWGVTWYWKLATVLLFFLYNLYFFIFHNNRCLGMMLINTNWEENYPKRRWLLHGILYTLSFSTLFVWIVFPFDLFMLNILCQWLCIQRTGTTIHGFLSGMYSVRYRRWRESIIDFFRTIFIRYVSH